MIKTIPRVHVKYQKEFNFKVTSVPKLQVFGYKNEQKLGLLISDNLG